MFSHTTAAWVWGLIETEPKRIHITVPGRRRSLPEVRIHHSRKVPTFHCRGFQVTPVARTLVDVAAMLSRRELRRAIAEAEFRDLLNRGEIEALLRHRRPGSKALRTALASHLPELAHTISALEVRFLELCESAGLPMPGVNARVGRMRVDALWRDQRVAVELDGSAGHGGWSQVMRDRERELVLRRMGFQVVRYTWRQVMERPEEVIADLRRLLGHD